MSALDQIVSIVSPLLPVLSSVGAGMAEDAGGRINQGALDRIREVLNPMPDDEDELRSVLRANAHLQAELAQILNLKAETTTISVGSVTITHGDFVAGDKVGGDKVEGNKYGGRRRRGD